jgi:DNA-binding NtrC family response regulator
MTETPSQHPDTHLVNTLRDMIVPKEHILVVDDDPVFREMLSLYLGGQGYNIDTADNGEDAIGKFKPGVYGCVICDFSMPGIDGIELLRRLKAQDNKILFFMVTGYPNLEKAVEAIKLGAHDYISKPFDLEALRIKLERSLYTQHLEKSLDLVNLRFKRLALLIPFVVILAIVLALLWKR